MNEDAILNRIDVERAVVAVVRRDWRPAYRSAALRSARLYVRRVMAGMALDDIAREQKLTRERVRQIVDKFSKQVAWRVRRVQVANEA